MGRRRPTTIARSIFVSLAFAALVALPAPALADGGVALGDMLSPASALAERAASEGDEASQVPDPPALTAQATGSPKDPKPVGSVEEAQRVIDYYKNNGPMYLRMSAQWTGHAVHIPANADVTIYMSESFKLWRRRQNNGEAFVLEKGSKLHLVGGKGRFYEDLEIYQVGGGIVRQRRLVGGLITGGYSTDGGGAITMKENTRLTLDDITIAGCRADQKGGSDGYGGAIYAKGKNTQITLRNCDLIGNYAENNGGAICADKELCTVTLKNTTMDGNVAGKDGGGVYFNGKTSRIAGDGASSIRYGNALRNGGGVFFDKEKCSVMNVTIEHNRAAEDGGGIYVNGEHGSLSRLNVKNNAAGKYGGGIRFNKNDTAVSQCTLTNNTC